MMPAPTVTSPMPPLPSAHGSKKSPMDGKPLHHIHKAATATAADSNNNKSTIDDFLILVRFDGKIQCINLETGLDAWCLATCGSQLCSYTQKSSVDRDREDSPASSSTSPQTSTLTTRAHSLAVTTAPVMLAGFGSNAVHTYVLHGAKLVLADEQRLMNQDLLIHSVASFNTSDSSYMEIKLRDGEILVDGVDDTRRVTPTSSGAPNFPASPPGPVLAMVRQNKHQSGRIRLDCGGATVWKFTCSSVSLADIDSPSLKTGPFASITPSLRTPLMIMDRPTSFGDDISDLGESTNNSSRRSLPHTPTSRQGSTCGAPLVTTTRVDVFVDGHWRVFRSAASSEQNSPMNQSCPMKGSPNVYAPPPLMASWFSGTTDGIEIVKAYHYSVHFGGSEKLHEVPVKIFDDESAAAVKSSHNKQQPADRVQCDFPFHPPSPMMCGEGNDETQLYINAAAHFLFIIGEVPETYEVQAAAASAAADNGDGVHASTSWKVRVPKICTPSNFPHHRGLDTLRRGLTKNNSIATLESVPSTNEVELIDDVQNANHHHRYHKHNHHHHHHLHDVSQRKVAEVQVIESINSVSSLKTQTQTTVTSTLSGNDKECREGGSKLGATPPRCASTTARQFFADVDDEDDDGEEEGMVMLPTGESKDDESLERSQSASDDDSDDEMESAETTLSPLRSLHHHHSHSNSSGPHHRHIDPLNENSVLARDADETRTVVSSYSDGTTSSSSFKGHPSFFESNFEPIKLLGQGTSGVVLLARQKVTGILYAIKIIIAESKFDEEEILREVKLHAPLQCDNIVRYHSCWSEVVTRRRMEQIKVFLLGSAEEDQGMIGGDSLSDDGTVSNCDSASSLSTIARNVGRTAMFLQMEYCNTTMAVRLAKRRVIDRIENLAVAIQLLNGVQYLHERGIVHRDLKPTNVMILLDGDLEDDVSEDLLCGDIHAHYKHIAKVLRSQQRRTKHSIATPHHHFGNAETDGEDDEDEEEEYYKAPFVVKLGDLGLAKTEGDRILAPAGYFERTETHTIGVGSPVYSSPEQLNGTTCHIAGDIFSLGIILAELYLKPTTVSERLTVLLKARERCFEADWLTKFPELKIAMDMLHHNPEKRISIPKAKKRLRDILKTLVRLP